MVKRLALETSRSGVFTARSVKERSGSWRCCQRTLKFWEHWGRSLFWGMGFGKTERHRAKSPPLKQNSTFEWNIRCSVKYFRPQKRRLGQSLQNSPHRVPLKRLGMSSHSQCSPLCTGQWLNSSERILLILLINLSWFTFLSFFFLNTHP